MSGRGGGDSGGRQGRGDGGWGRGRGGRCHGGEGEGRGRRGGYGYERALSSSPQQASSVAGFGDFPPLGPLSLSPGNPPTRTTTPFPYPYPQQAPPTQPARPQQAPRAQQAALPAAQTAAPLAAPSSSASSAASTTLRPPPRPGYGSLGKKCFVRANHFLVEVAEKDLHHYDVTITPQVTSKKINRNIIGELVGLYSESHLGNKRPAYDGRKSLYTAGPLPFESKEFVVKLVDKEDNAAGSSSRKKDREFKVVIRFASKADLHHLQEFLRGRQLDAPQETIQVLDVVLRATASEKYTVVGRSFFHPNLGVMGELGDGIEYWRGYYQSIRPTQMGLSFNVDVSATPFYEPILVTEFVAKYINRDLSRPLSDQDRIRVKRALRGVKVKLMYGDYAKCHKIMGITNQTLKQISFSQGDQEARISIVEYYRNKYKKDIKFTNLPALQAGKGSKDISLPMELCQIVQGQRYLKKLNERQVTNLLRATCERPKIREGNIKQVVKGNCYNDDQLVKDEFGIRVKEDLALINARVLQAPRLKYHDSGKEKGVNPSLGQWNMINKKMVNGGKVDFWTCVNFSTRLNQDLPSQFCGQLIEMCQSKGMDFNLNPIVPITTARPNQIERTLHDIHKQSKEILDRLRNQEKKEKKYHLQLLFVILPDVSGSYGKIKRICETQLGIVSQCIQPWQAAKLSKQYFENVALKINVKVGGRNTVLVDAIQRKIPLVSDRPTIVFGADVTHPNPGEDSNPSIAAVVASMDWPEITKYRATVCTQRHREEIIQDLYTTKLDPEKGVVAGGMIREQIKAFRRATGYKPEKIIFFRDGVSEGQFSQVLYYEMKAIRQACVSLENEYLPRVTFVVVQKRHHTRLFPADHNNRDLTDKSGNVLPGTVVDTQICHPIEFDFYLNSHAGIQGTSRPAHYHVLYDENNFSADGLQQLINDMCYTFARCTRSVSLVPPAYYAHLAAFRARYYLEGEISDSGSGTTMTEQNDNKAVKALPPIHENVKDVMFYC